MGGGFLPNRREKKFGSMLGQCWHPQSNIAIGNPQDGAPVR